MGASECLTPSYTTGPNYATDRFEPMLNAEQAAALPRDFESSRAVDLVPIFWRRTTLVGHTALGNREWHSRDVMDQSLGPGPEPNVVAFASGAPSGYRSADRHHRMGVAADACWDSISCIGLVGAP